MLGHRSYYFMFLVPALALLACGGEKPIDETTGAVEEPIPVGGVHLAGTYTGDSQQAGDFSQLVLKTDGTYHAKMVVWCFTLPCNPVEQDGRYTLFRRESLTYFQTYDASGTMNGRYQYLVRGDTLNLRNLIASSTWTTMLRSPTAWCATSQDCALQELVIGPCAGQYICTEGSTCNWSCGPAPEVAGANRKPGAGG
jgi:hypothetical protein